MTSLDRFNRKIKIEEVSISKTRIEPKFQTSPLKSTDKIFPEKNETLETFPIYKKEVKPISPLLHLKDFQNPEKKKGHCKRTNSAILTRRSLMHQNVESFTPKLQDSDSAKSEAGSPQIKSPLFKDSPERKSNFKHTISKTKTMEIQKSSHYREKEGESAGMWDVFLDVIKKEGVMGLYKGITPLLIGNFISYGVYFFW